MPDQMKDEDLLRIYAGWSEISRKWVSVMDAKAGFLSALNAALLGFIWTGAKVTEAGDCPKILALTASAFSIISLFAALMTVLPRGSLPKIFGNNSRYVEGFKAVSFYGYVAANYPKGDEARFFKEIEAMDVTTLKLEALEQHYTISHGLQIKSNWVNRAGWLLIIALILTVSAFLSKILS